MKYSAILFVILFLVLVSSLTAQESFISVDTALARQYLEEAITLTNEREFDRALEKATIARKAFEAAMGEESKEVADVWQQIGDTGFKKGDYALTTTAYKEVLKIHIAVYGSESLEAAMAYNNLGSHYKETGASTQALDCHQRALEIRLKALGTDHPEVANSFMNIGIVYFNEDALDSAIQYQMKALNIRLKTLGESHLKVAISYHNLGAVFKSKGAFDQAIDYQQRALVAFKEAFGPEHINVAKGYNNMGNVYEAKGAYGKAIDYLQRSLRILNNNLGPEHPLVATSLMNLGINYNKIGDNAKAISCHQKALQIRLKVFGPSHPFVAQVYMNMGAAYTRMKEYNRAFENYQNALAIRLDALGPDHPRIAMVYNNLGNLEKDKAAFDQAIYYQQQALKIWEKTFGPANSEVATSYNNLGNAYANQRKYLLAQEHFSKAFSALNYSGGGSLQSVTSIPVLITALENQGNWYRAWYGEEQSAGYLYRSRNKYLETFIALDFQFKSLSPATRVTMANTAHPFYEGALLTNHLLYRETDSTQYLTESFDLAERSKALLLYQSIQEADALQYAGIPGSLLEREYNLRIDLSYYDQKRQERLSEGLEETDSTVLSISSKLFDLNQSYDSLKTHFEEEYPEYYRLKYDLSTISVEEIQKELLNPDQSLLEFFVGDSTIFIFLISQKDYDVIQVRKDTAIEAWVSQLRRGLKAPYNSEEPEDSPYRNSSYSAQQYADAAVKLYDKLIAPVKDKLQPKVIIIPDGVLGYLPFQALLEEMPARPYRFHTHSYFGREHQLSYSYSATLLKEMQNKVHRAEPGKSLLAMAPFYDGTLYTLDSLYKAELAELELEESLATTARSAFESLPYSGAEAYTASQLWDGDFLQGDEATEQHFREMAGQYRMLHLATHGAANDEVGEYAYLAFTEVDDSLENELLFVKDIYNLQLNADLVILSACQTATGELQRGEGIISLARAFAYAGAKSITTTLWSVNDQKTKGLMSRFHRYLKKGEAKDTSLWKAQSRYLKKHKGEAASPYFWAGFIGIGDMRALE